MARKDRPNYVIDFRENYMCSYARPIGLKYTAVTAFPLPARYNIHRMSLYIGDTHIGTVFAPFGSSVTWNNLTASEYYTTTTQQTTTLFHSLGWSSTTEVSGTGQQVGGNRNTTTTSTSGSEPPGVLPWGIPKVYYYDYNGNLRYVAHVQPS
jgi:hypothetical protein